MRRLSWSASRQLDGETLFLEGVANPVAMISLNFNDVILHGASSTTELLELFGKLFQGLAVEGDATDGGDPFPLAATGFAPYPHNTVAGRRCGSCCFHRFDATLVSGIHQARFVVAAHGSLLPCSILLTLGQPVMHDNPVAACRCAGCFP